MRIPRPTRRALTASVALSTTLGLSALAAPAMADHSAEAPDSYGNAGDETIVVPINDSAAGGTYYQPFVNAYADETEDGTPVYVYVPTGALDGVEGVHSLDPAFDHNEGDGFVPCADHDPADYAITQEQVDYLGDQLRDQILAVNEDHFGELGEAASGSDALVTLVYNVQDEMYYDCAQTSYTAGYFAPEFLEASSLGMNVMVIDAFDWANRVGEDPSTAPWSDGDPANDRPSLYEGVVAHELEHMLMNYSDPGELSWVDEGLADMAAFLNDYDMTGSHLTYQQVFHRETSLTRWGGGLENYGASFSYFLYQWEQAGGNGGGSLGPDLTYDGTAGDLLIKLIFAEEADGMVGVQNAINDFNAETGGDLESAEELFKDWAIAMYLDDEASELWDLANFDLGPASGGWTIDVANGEFWGDRGSYQGALPDAKWDRMKNRPAGTALPFGVSYEKMRNPGPQVAIEFEGEPGTQIAPHTGDTHWWAGYQSQSDHVLDLTTAVSGGEEVTFWNWHFIEEGWDYGFVEAMVDGEWVTLEVTDASGTVVSTMDDPHGNNTEGHGITGTSGGVYFVDEPEYVQYAVDVPEGATDLRFRYSTDAAYLDTGWFIDDVAVDGTAAALSPEDDQWVETTGAQENNWVVQVISSCDLVAGATEAEIRDQAGNFVYRYEGDAFTTDTFHTKCANGKQGDFAVSVSNLPTGDLSMLDASYDYRVVNTAGKKKGR